MALLALRADQAVERAWLAGVFWPDTSAEQAFNNLRRSLSNLRQVLGAEAHRLYSPTSSTITLNLAGAFCDVLTFDAAIARGDTLSLQQAAALYRGPLLEACGEAWALPERALRQERYLQALKRLAQEQIDCGELPEAARLLRRALEVDPFSEETTQRLMQILGRQGEYAAAEKLFRQLRQLLHKELNMEPSVDTLALHRDLLQQARMASLSHRETALGPAVNHRMPVPLTLLVGRTRDLEAICTALQAARLITVTGPGGVGKTRLSLAVAEAVADDYADGVVFVDLAPTSDIGTLVKAITVALGIRQESDLSPEEALCRFLQRKRVLVILDNTEHVLPACAQTVVLLLSQCPLLHLLCTSREPLRVAGEHVWQVAPLETPPLRYANDPASKTTRLLSYDAVALLIARATAASADFRLTAQNAEAIAQICRRLDGMPLALELAAARFRNLSAQEIAVRLDDYFRLLSLGDPTLPRHRTLRAAIEWSDSLLDPAERHLLQQLSVFVGGWTLEAAEAICPAESGSVFLLLLSLMEKSLVVCEQQEEQTRYRLLEMTREYAAECLSPELRSLQRERHAVFFLRLLEESEPSGQREGAPPLYTQVRADRDNLRAAQVWWKEHDHETALRLEYLIYALGSERPDDWRTRIAQLAADPLPPTSLSLLMTLQTGRWALWTGYPEAETLLLRATEIASVCGVVLWEMAALSALTTLERDRGNDAQVLLYTEAALRLAKEYGDIYVIARFEVQVCEMLVKTGREAEAQRRLQVQLERGRREDDWRILFPTLDRLAELAFEAQDWVKAGAYWEELLPMTRKLQPEELPNLLRNLAETACERQDYAAAWQYLEEGIAASRRNRALDREGWTRWDMSKVAFRQGEIAMALEQLRLCVGLFHDNEEARSVAQCLRQAAYYHKAAGRHELAALLLGSVERRRREQALNFELHAEKAYQALVTELSTLLGEEAWQAAFERGQLLMFEEAEKLAFA